MRGHFQTMLNKLIIAKPSELQYKLIKIKFLFFV